MSGVKLGTRWILALLLVGVAAYAATLLRNLSWFAGGADSSGYLNEARLMAAGKTDLPNALLSTLHLDNQWGHVFAPLGFRQSIRDPRRMVPLYPPGLPAHFALAGWVGGWARAPFLIPPLAALASLALMFILGRQFGLSPLESAAGVIILAVCPIFMFMAAQPMSDIVATMWTLAAIVAALAKRPAMAGAAFAISVCVRPTNLLMAIPLAFGLRRPRHLIFAAAGALPVAIALMAWNHALFGGLFTTGYGSVREMMAWDYARLRLPHYSYWLAAQLSPWIFPGGLFVAIDRVVDRWGRALLLSWFLVIFAFYCFYDAYDAWWYTRFLLPAIPPLIIGFLLLLRDHRMHAGVAVIAVALILALLLWQDRQLKPLTVGEDESIYPETIRWAEQQLPRDAIVLDGQFSGAFLYYSGRHSVRWDQLNDENFQVLRAYVGAQNLRWYAVLSGFEFDAVQKNLRARWSLLGERRGVKLLRLD